MTLALRSNESSAWDVGNGGGSGGPDFHLMSEMLQAAFKRGSELPQPVQIAITLSLGALALVGLLGNILVVIFFYRGLRDLPQNVYVIALATLDMAVCAVVIPSTVYQDVWRGATTDLMCKAFHILRCSLVTSSAFLLCLIAVDRFAIICFVPGIQTGRRRAVRLIGLTLLLGFAVGTPLGLTTGTRRNIIVRKNGIVQNHPVIMANCISDYSILPAFTVKVYKACLTLLFLCMLLAIVFFYANIFYFVRRRQRRWDKSRTYVSRVSSGKDKGGGHREGVDNKTDDKDRNGHPRSDEIGSVRFAQPESSRVLLETDIDQVLGGPDQDPAAAAAVQEGQVEAKIIFNQESRREDAVEAVDAEDEDDEAVVASGAAKEAPEQRRMLAGAAGQRREDSVVSNRLARAQRHLSERSRKRPHIKTAKVLSIITFFYLLSYLPFFLVFHLQDDGGGGGSGAGGVGSLGFGAPPSTQRRDNSSGWSAAAAGFVNWTTSAAADNYSQLFQLQLLQLHRLYDRTGLANRGIGGAGAGSAGAKSSRMSLSDLFKQTVYYFYFINHGVNPVIYGCMNTFFKQQLCGMFNSVRRWCRRGSSAA